MPGPSLSDTDPEAERVQLDLLRAAGPGRRAQMALDLRHPVSSPHGQAVEASLCIPPCKVGLYAWWSCQQRQSTRIQARARIRTACG